MAEVEATRIEIKTRGDDCHVMTWANLTAANDTGEAIEMPGSVNRSVQMSGTFGAGGKVVLEGSNNGNEWIVLTDGNGNVLRFTGPGLSNVGELTRYIRPRREAGASVDVTVDLLMRRPHR